MVVHCVPPKHFASPREKLTRPGNGGGRSWLLIPVILCLIRAGMVLTITEIWRVFVQERDFSGNIAKPMEKAKRSNLAKTKVHKSTKAMIDGGKIKAKKTSKTSIKTITRKSKKSMVLEKSETKTNFLRMILKAKKLCLHLSICLKKLMNAA